LGADYDFSRTDRGRAPEGLPSIPEQLGNLNLNAGVASAEEDDSESDDSAENGDEEQEVADSNDGENQENNADVAVDNENTGENEADVALNTPAPASQTPDNNLANNPAVNNNDSQIIAALTRLSESADENPNLTDKSG